MGILIVSLCVLVASLSALSSEIGDRVLMGWLWIISSAVAAAEFSQLRSPAGWKESVWAAAVGPSIVVVPVIVHYIFVMRPLPESLPELFSRFVELIYFTFCGSLFFGVFGGTIGIVWYFLRKTAERPSP